MLRRKCRKRVADGVTGYAGSERKDTNGGADHQESDQQPTGEPADDTGKEASEGGNARKTTETRSKRFVDT